VGAERPGAEAFPGDEQQQWMLALPAAGEKRATPSTGCSRSRPCRFQRFWL